MRIKSDDRQDLDPISPGIWIAMKINRSRFRSIQSNAGGKVMNKNLLLLGGIGLGAGLMYIFDPDRGRRRRTTARDAAHHIVNVLDDAVGKTSRDLSNRAQGLVAELDSIFRCEDADDDVVAARVRSKLGRAVSHPHAVQVAVNQGRVTLSGQILATEVDQLLNRVWSVRGVTGVENRLEAHEQAGDLSSLQGGTPHRGETSELMQSDWSPAIRFLAGIGGGALTLYGARRKDIFSAAVGLGLVTRSLTNMGMEDLIGLDGGQGIAVQKTITINAPVRKVFELWSRHENFPHFMSRVRKVKDLGNGRYHWTVVGPAGIPVEWEALITKLEPDRLIAWQSAPGSMIEQRGIVRFRSEGDDNTVVDVRLSYYPPAGAIGHAIASLFGADPKSEMDDDLMRMKSFIETGHQPHDAGEGQARRVSVH
jgi:uncharacterized membrane protein/osmotically-inducible protein OsmY